MFWYLMWRTINAGSRYLVVLRVRAVLVPLWYVFRLSPVVEV